MTDQTSVSISQGRRRVCVELAEEEIDDILSDLPGGQSVSEATRRLYQELHQARRRPAPAGHLEPGSHDIVYGPALLARPIPERLPRRFQAVRKIDVSGVSGVGVIVEGCTFSDGATVQRWLGGPPQYQPGWQFFDNPGTAPFEQISGHNGNTEIIWIDPWENDMEGTP